MLKLRAIRKHRWASASGADCRAFEGCRLAYPIEANYAEVSRPQAGIIAAGTRYRRELPYPANYHNVCDSLSVLNAGIP